MHHYLKPGARVRLFADDFRPPTSAIILSREVTEDGTVLYRIETEHGLEYGATPSEIMAVL